MQPSANHTSNATTQVFTNKSNDSMALHEAFMRRCLQLAALGRGYTYTNPLVGAVLVHNRKIIGEGYHKQFGQAHAEVNCINSVAAHQKHLIPLSTLYVSLEPCNHFGKTPPCSHLILKMGIKKVVIGATDANQLVNGTGIEYLLNHQVEVVKNVLEKECIELNKHFFTAHQNNLPFITLKWAKSQNNLIGDGSGNRLHISNSISQLKVHELRSAHQAILVGANTLINDDPLLDNRYWYGRSPIKIIIDSELKHYNKASLTQTGITIVLNKIKQSNLADWATLQQLNTGVFYWKQAQSLTETITALHQHLGIQSLLVEGGAQVLTSFIQEKLYHQIIEITSSKVQEAKKTIFAPLFERKSLTKAFNLMGDTWQIHNY
jgi:diaminohydroxyphosphoribosylaminopyrimidine deaminase / 5-amino-6-(5-phosphoribosylamino)uracil reductase